MVTLSKTEENHIFETIDRVLKQVFGEDATRLMYQYLERRYSWGEKGFLEKIDVFAKGMEEFLSSGAYLVETKILDIIYASHTALREAKAESFEERDFASQICLAIQKA